VVAEELGFVVTMSMPVGMATFTVAMEVAIGASGKTAVGIQLNDQAKTLFATVC
jgi:hypothetical protein